MPPLRTHYDTLNIPRDASLETIQTAYRSLALQYHPDRSGDSPENETAMQALNAAYEVLSDPLQRADYDRTLEPELGPEPPIPSSSDFETPEPTVSPASFSRHVRASESTSFTRSLFSAFLLLAYLVATFTLLYLPGYHLLGLILLLAGWLRYRHTHPR